MPVPGNVGTFLSEFFPGVFGDGTSGADQHVVNPAGRTVQNATVRAFSVNNALPFSYRRFHDADLVHETSSISMGIRPWFRKKMPAYLFFSAVWGSYRWLEADPW
jgi:hypothetical protein